MSTSIDFSLRKDENFDSLTATTINTNSITVSEDVTLIGSDLIIIGGNIDIDTNGGNIDMHSVGGNMLLQATGASNTGGDVFFTATEGGGSGGDIFITATDLTGNGGTIQFIAVDSSGSGGNFIANCIDLSAVVPGSGSNFTINGTSNTAGAGLNLTLTSTNGQSHFLINSTTAAVDVPPTVTQSFGDVGTTTITGNDHMGTISINTTSGVGAALNDTITVTYTHPFAVGTTTFVVLSGGSGGGTQWLLNTNGDGTFTRLGGEMSVIGTNTNFVMTFNQSPGRALSLLATINYQVFATTNS